MRRASSVLILALLFLLSGSPTGFAQKAEPQIAAKDRMVVIISLDGFPAWSLDDPKLPIPTLRKLWGEGAAAKRMSISNPAVTWPNHTTLMTGVPPAKHGVLFNGLLMRDGGPQSPVRVEQWRDKSELVRVPTVYDLAYKSGLTTAQVDWVPTLNSGTFTWEFAEIPIPHGKVEQEMVAEGTITEKELMEFNKANPAWRDEYWTKAAVHILTKHKPNLLLLHLLNLDAINHRYGPQTFAGYTGFAYLDSRVKEVLQAVEMSGMLPRATILIVSDHGFKTIKRSIRPNAVLLQHGLLKAENGKVQCDAYVIPEGGTAMVYITDAKKREQLIPQLKELFRPVEGITRILEPADYPALGLPTPAENNQMADLVLVAKEGYGFAGAYQGEVVVDVGEGTYPGNHGYLSSDPEMDAIFMAWGYGIRPGVRLDRISNLDVAPTTAALLGLKMEGVAGKELHQILMRPATSSR